MPFPERRRDYDKRVQGSCQTMVYTEATGYQPCGSTVNLEDDHLDVESNLLQNGSTGPNNSDGIIRCQQHHTGDGIGEDGEIAPYGDPNWSRHPDMGAARHAYRAGDKDAFKNAAHEHRTAEARGERVTNDDEGVVEYERARVEDLRMEHFLETGETMPTVKEHKDFEKKHWWDNLFD